MRKPTLSSLALLVLLLLGPVVAQQPEKQNKHEKHPETQQQDKQEKQEKRSEAQQQPPVLWTDPADISSRNLLYGPGGQEHQPAGTMKFVEEDPAGHNPKFDVTDEAGTKWKVKMGPEARPETAASRLDRKSTRLNSSHT